MVTAVIPYTNTANLWMPLEGFPKELCLEGEGVRSRLEMDLIEAESLLLQQLWNS